MKEIEKIINSYTRTDWSAEKAALGTVVKVEESAYRRVGARMYVSSNGNWVGGISGGCLEGDALKRAQIAINKNESSIVVYDTMDDDSHQIGVGLGCNGRIEVLFTPIDYTDPNNPIEFLKTIITTRKTEVLLQCLSHTSGRTELISSFYPSQELHSLSKITGVATADLQNAINTSKHKRKSKVFNLENSKGEQFEMLVELIHPKIKVICIGDNYDVNAFVGIVEELGWEIHVAGKIRKLSKDIFHSASTVCTYEEAPNIKVDEYTAVILMSHDYKTDLTLLKHFIDQPLPYIGLLGPKKRMEKMQLEIANERALSLSDLPNLYSPVGLDIGAESPEEIALSIVSEIVATIRKREGRSLKYRSGPIHERD